MARPKIAAEKLRTATIGVRVSPGEYAALRKKAAEMGLTPAQWLRTAALARRLPAPAAGPTKMPRAPAQGQVPLGGSSTGCAAWDTMAATPIRRPAGIPAAAHGDHEKVTAVRRRGPFRRLNRSARWLAGLVLALIVTGLVCVAWLASLPRPEPGSVPIPFVTVIPAGTPWTPPAAVSTSVP